MSVSIKDSARVSPSLLENLDGNNAVPTDLMIGWEELLGVPIDPKDYIGLAQLPEATDELLLMASQQYEESEGATNCDVGPVQVPEPDTTGVDELLLMASQQYEASETSGSCVLPDLNVPADMEELLLQASQLYEEPVAVVTESETLMSACVDAVVTAEKPSGSRFGIPQRERDVQEVKESRVPKKTQNNTEWAQNIWRQWATHRITQLSDEERRCGCVLRSDITKMPTVAVNYWLTREPVTS